MKNKILLILAVICISYLIVINLSYKYNEDQLTNKATQLDTINSILQIEEKSDTEIIDTIKTGSLIHLLYIHNNKQNKESGVIVLKKHLFLDKYKYEYTVHEVDGTIKYVGIDYYKNYLMEAKEEKLYNTNSYSNNTMRKNLYRFLGILLIIEILYRLRRRKSKPRIS